jgi:hypothetical protein
MSGWDNYWIGRTIREMTIDHTPHLPFRYMEDPIVMMNDERVLNAFVEDHPNFTVEDGCRMLSMDAVRLIKAMKRVGLDLQWGDSE